MVVVVLLLWGVTPAPAQSVTSGAWFSAGGGVGWAGGFPVSGALAAPSGYVRGGWALNDQVRLGAEFNAWRPSPDDLDYRTAYRMYNLAATVTFYPAAHPGLHFRAGAGLGIVAGDVDLYKGLLLDAAKGPGLVVGLGYDVPVGRHVSITPTVSLWAARIGDLSSGQTVLRNNWSQHVIDITLGVTFR
ncbi:MAG: hypothetical protein IT181_08550 [Acidobacteria bacterium]|nr:hypothetical protein [Acidobacteriota bacterium]